MQGNDIIWNPQNHVTGCVFQREPLDSNQVFFTLLTMTWVRIAAGGVRIWMTMGTPPMTGSLFSRSQIGHGWIGSFWNMRIDAGPTRKRNAGMRLFECGRSMRYYYQP